MTSQHAASPADSAGLCDFEYQVLAMLDGSGPAMPWGAAVGAALGFLKGSGYVALAGGVRYTITERGRAALAARAALL
ncbi:MAG: hypothetical protein V4593_08060 [Pseudomonadota bacterium]